MVLTEENNNIMFYFIYKLTTRWIHKSTCDDADTDPYEIKEPFTVILTAGQTHDGIEQGVQENQL